MKPAQLIRTAHTCATEARRAVQEFHAAVSQPEMELVVFFCSSGYDLDALADEMNRKFPGQEVVGCTTAGEIGPAGYRERSLAGASFGRGAVTAETGLLKDLKSFELGYGQAFARTLMQQLVAREPTRADNAFAFLLIDGLSIREEAVTRTLQNALGKIPLVGGSAGDNLQFARTCVFHGGAFHSDAAVLILISTLHPFQIFKTQNFARANERLVVTKADAAHRVVNEINGRPAAEEYARLIGARTDELTPARFAATPVVVVIDGTDYVRSIQKANPDGSLTFYCAIDEGLVFRVAHGHNLVSDLERTFTGLRKAIGAPQLVLTCNCILRDLETKQRGLQETVGEIFRHNNAVGFSTYGEQFLGMHVNQTLTGVAIGESLDAVPAEAQPANAGNPEDNFLSTTGEDKASAHLVETTGNDLGDETALRNEVVRLNRIIDALMNRAERAMGAQLSDFGMFQTAILLENQIRDRTRELEAAERENERINRDLQRANRELEAFSYSVAHDLRAPLRAIDGFSRILERNIAERISPDDRENLARIRDAARRMGQLIDDLLNLSRCSRADLHRQPVNLAFLAREIIAGYRQAEPERRVEFSLPENLPALGDPRLLTALLENLLGNAWKYTRQRPTAHIEFGYNPELAAYYLRDDGAGFDMAYAGKLFQVFQRLHSASEFEGTGIGLAIVQRIVERHGGRVWAEGRTNQGASFYFTLPDKTAFGTEA